MESEIANIEFINSLDIQPLLNYFRQLAREHAHLERQRSLLKSKYFVIIQRNIADTFTTDDYHQRVDSYTKEFRGFTERIDTKNRQLSYISTKLQHLIQTRRNGLHF